MMDARTVFDSENWFDRHDSRTLPVLYFDSDLGILNQI